MATTCHCPSCNRSLKAPDELLGQEVQCPACSATFVIHAEAARPEPRSSAAAPPAAWPEEKEDRSPPRDYPGRRYPEDDDEWDEQARRWAAPQVTILPGRGRAVFAVIVLALAAVLSVISLPVDLYAFQLAARQAAGQPVPPAQANALIDLLDLLALAQGGLGILSLVATCLWFYRAHANLGYLHVRGLQYSPGWAVGYFFIPILNLFRPCQVAQEIWKASDPNVPADDSRAWAERPASALVGFWWALWLISGVLATILFQMGMRGDPNPAEAKTLNLIAALGDVASAPADLLLLLVILKIQARQAARHERVLAGQDREDMDDEAENGF